MKMVMLIVITIFMVIIIIFIVGRAGWQLVGYSQISQPPSTVWCQPHLRDFFFLRCPPPMDLCVIKKSTNHVQHREQLTGCHFRRSGFFVLSFLVSFLESAEALH